MRLSKWIFMTCFGYILSKTLSGNINEVTDVNVANPANTTDGEVVLDYFSGNQSDANEESQTQNIDTVQDLFVDEHNISSINGTVPNIGKEENPSDEAFRENPFFMTKALDLMKQSIYATRYRLQDTRKLRLLHSSDPCYSAAIYYGSLMQLRIKLDNVFNTMKKLHYSVKFIWYLQMYERILAINVDVTSIVERIFKLKALLLSVLPGH